MSKAMAVTGFVNSAFPAKHLSEAQCREYGKRLQDALPGKVVAFDGFDWTLDQCWVPSMFPDLDKRLLPSVRDVPADRFACPYDMVISNMILLQRYYWMAMAAALHPDVDTFAWIEYTVLKQRGVTERVLQDFMQSIENKTYDAISLPGCWPKGPIDDGQAHWRFCGSCWVCPERYAVPLYSTVRRVVALRTEMTRKVSFDMNTMAYVELLDVLPIRWYEANHDETQFTHY